MPPRPPADAPPARHGLSPLPPELDPRGRHRTSHGPNGRRLARIGGRIVSATLSIVLLAGFAYGWWNYRQLNGNLKRLNVAVGATAPGHHDIDGQDQNILIVGNDDRSDTTPAELRALGTGPDGGSLATDTMMIVHIPANGAKATLISLPRDSYVNIPGYGMNKLNAAYADAYTATSGSLDAQRAAGANLLIKTIFNLTGVTIDHFVEVDLIGFYRISNAIGGVPVNLCANVNDPTSGFIISKGVHLLQGKQALLFVRQRYSYPDGNGDFDRVMRQRYFLTAAFRAIASAGTLLNPAKLSNLVAAVDKSVYVDQGLSLSTLARQLSNLTADNIVGKTIPTDGYNNNTPAGSVVVVNPTEVKQFIAALIGSNNTALSKAKTVSPASVTVDVRNAGTVNGAATQNADILRQDGFAVGTVTTSTTASTSTVIEYAPGMEAQAKTLAAYVPGASYQLVNSVPHVTLLLGADGLTAKVIAPATGTPAPKATTAPATTAPPAVAAPKPKPIDAGCIN